MFDLRSAKRDLGPPARFFWSWQNKNFDKAELVQVFRQKLRRIATLVESSLCKLSDQVLFVDQPVTLM